jgi:predicted Zn-dependent protease
MCRRSLVLVPLLLLAGCVPLEFLDPNPTGTAMVPTSPFGTQPVVQAPVKTNFRPASDEMALRVDAVRRKILTANPKLPVRPLVATVGQPEPEIFHQGAQIIYITAGLITRCKNEDELAALLCLELGKMVSEQPAQARTPEAPRPMTVPIGNAGQVGPQDQVGQVELAKYEAERKRAKRQASPDPRALAAKYLEKAGYDKRALDTIGPLLEAAEKTYKMEKQFRSTSGPPAWTAVAPQ